MRVSFPDSREIDLTYDSPSSSFSYGFFTLRVSIHFHAEIDLKIIIISSEGGSHARGRSEIVTLSRPNRSVDTISPLPPSKGEWQLISPPIVTPLPLSSIDLVKMILALVAGHLKAGMSLEGNYVFDAPTGTTHKRKLGKRRSDASNAHLKGHTSVHEVAAHFHRPINEASRHLKICPTVLKKICRKAGLPRWPHRKLQSIDRELTKLQQLVAEEDTQTEEQVEGLKSRIRHLQKERKAICFEQ